MKEPRIIIIGNLLELHYRLDPAKRSIKAYQKRERTFKTKTVSESFIFYKRDMWFDTPKNSEQHGIFVIHDHLARTLSAYANKGHRARVIKIIYKNPQGENYQHRFKRPPLAVGNPDTVTLLQGKFVVTLERGIEG